MRRKQEENPSKKNNRRNPDIFRQKEGVMFRTKEGEVIPIANPIWIEEIRINRDTNEVVSKISYRFLDAQKSTLVKREDYLNKANLIKLQAIGLDVVKSNIDPVIEYLRDEEESAKKVCVHSKLGFTEDSGELVYRHYREERFDSTYCGELDIEPKGSRERWLQMFRNEVKDQPALVFMCCVALASIMSTFLEDITGGDCLVVHVVGDSTTGKSTSCKLGISLFGNPSLGKNGLFTSYNSTDNAIMKTLSGIRGMAVALDELSMSSSKNQGNFVYKLANGTNKARLNQDSTMKEREEWTGTTILSNGEKSLLGCSVKNPGLIIRVLEVENVQMTKSATNAEKINEVVGANYGHIGPEFAKFLVEKGTEEVGNIYKKACKYLLNVLQNRHMVDSYTERRVKKLALVYATGKLFSEMIDEEIDKKELVKFLLQVEKTSMAQRNVQDNIVERIQQYVCLNRHKFSSKSGKAMYEYWGKISEKKGYVEVQFNKIKFDEIVQEFGYENVNVVLEILKSKKILDHETGRLVKRRNNEDGIRTSYVVLKLPKGTIDVEEDRTEEHPLDNLE